MKSRGRLKTTTRVRLRPPYTCTHTHAHLQKREHTYILKKKILKIKGWDEKIPFSWPASEPPSKHHTLIIAKLTDQSYRTGHSILYKVSDDLILTFPDSHHLGTTHRDGKRTEPNWLRQLLSSPTAYSNHQESLKKRLGLLHSANIRVSRAQTLTLTSPLWRAAQIILKCSMGQELLNLLNQRDWLL